MGQSNGVLVKEVAAFQRCPLTEASLYVHGCMHVCVRAFVHKCLCAFVRTYVRTYLCVCACMYMCTCLHVSVFICLCVHIIICVGLCVLMLIFCIRTYVRMHLRVCISDKTMMFCWFCGLLLYLVCRWRMTSCLFSPHYQGQGVVYPLLQACLQGKGNPEVIP